MREPPKLERADLLPCHFTVSAKVVVARPTFQQKKEVARLKELSMRIWSDAAFDPGWRQLVGQLSDTLLDFPMMTPDVPSLQHPLYWRALGFSSHEPNSDFQKYEEPLDGRGTVASEAEFPRGFMVKANASKEGPLSPLTSRYRGGILTQQCILFFLRTQPFIARAIVRRRQRLDLESRLAHYSFAFVAMEVTRSLALLFHMLHTRVQEPPNFPLQPDMHVSMPFDVDFTDPNPNYIFPMDACWAVLNERDAFLRLHCISLIMYDALYDQRGGGVADTYVVVSQLDIFVRDCIARSGDLAEMEALVLQVVGTRYAREQHDQLRDGVARRLVGAAVQHGISGSMQRRLQAQRELDAQEERERRERRERLHMEDADVQSARLERMLRKVLR